MMRAFSYRRFERERDLAFAKDAMLHAFNVPAERTEHYMGLVGEGELRVLERSGGGGGGGGRPVAMLARLPMRQTFGPGFEDVGGGGGAVSTLGIAAVAVAPEARGGGVGRELMASMLREARDEGFAVSSLYSAMHRLYRGVGYECAGLTYTCRVPASAVREAADRLRRACAGRGDGAAAVRPYEPGDFGSVERLALGRARGRHGFVERTAFFWARIIEPPGVPVRGFVVEVEGRVAGYVFVHRVADPKAGDDLRVMDWCWEAGNAEAASAVLGVVGGFSNQVRRVVWTGSPDDEAMLSIDNPRYGTAEVFETWMVRLVDVRRAVAERGYLPGVETEVVLEVRDEVLPENAGRWTLRVSAGRGTLERGGAGEALVVDARELAAVWAGFVDPRRAGVLGAEGARTKMEAKGRLASAFGGCGTAVCVDGF